MKEIFFNNIGLTCNFAELIENNSTSVSSAAIRNRMLVERAVVHTGGVEPLEMFA